MTRNDPLGRIVVLSRRLRWVLRVIAVLILVVTLLVLAGVPAPTALDVGGTKIDMQGMGFGRRSLVVLLILPIIVTVLASMHHTDRLLGLYQRGVVFSPENAHRIRRTGQLMMLLAVLDTLIDPLLLLASGVMELPLDRVNVDVNVGLLVAGTFILLIGHVTGVGAELAEDSALTI